MYETSTPYSLALDKTTGKKLSSDRNKCAEALAGKKGDDAPSIDVPKLLGKPRKATLEFLADGEGWKAAPPTSAFLKRMGK